MTSRWFARAEVEQMIAEGTMTDAKSLAAYIMLVIYERTQRGGPG